MGFEPTRTDRPLELESNPLDHSGTCAHTESSRRRGRGRCLCTVIERCRWIFFFFWVRTRIGKKEDILPRILAYFARRSDHERARGGDLKWYRVRFTPVFARCKWNFFFFWVRTRIKKKEDIFLRILAYFAPRSDHKRARGGDLKLMNVGTSEVYPGIYSLEEGDTFSAPSGAPCNDQTEGSSGRFRV